MRWILFLFLFAVGFTIAPSTYAQPIPPNCPPSLSAGYTLSGDSVSFCQDGVNLNITPNSTLKATDSYAVAQIPYNPYPWVGANQLFVGVDDIWSGIVPLPFPFCFFGQKYNAVVIGANGQVGFDLSQAGLFNAWSSNGIIAPASNAAMNNSIMVPYHDVDPSIPYAGKNITWDIYGTAPCRYMVISWDSVPMFSCNNLLVSQQVVLFESTYLIDINIKSKPVCAAWNGGVAHQGIQNANGTIAFMVPGRNGTQWTANNDSYRFTPAGFNASNLSYVWKEVPGGTVLGTGPTLSFFPGANTQVTVDMQVITDCDTIPAAIRDTINCVVTGAVTAGFTPEIHLGCVKDTVKFINTSVTNTPGTPTYTWTFGDGTSSIGSGPTHVYQTQDTFRIRLIAASNGCLDTFEVVIDLRHPVIANFSTDKDSVCLNDVPHFQATSISFPPPPNGLLSWYWGDGNQQINGPTSLQHTYQFPGTYTISVVVTDTLGCKDTASLLVYVGDPAFVDFTMSDNSVCVGDPVFFIDTLSSTASGWLWNFGEKQLANVHNPTFTWSAPSVNQSVTLTGYFPACPNQTITKNITINAYPTVNLGSDTSYCPGLTSSILLSNLNNVSGTSGLLWNTGSTASSIAVTQAGRYWLKVTDGECSTTDSIRIERDCYINIPNSFSPDGDGLNDFFFPRDLLSSGLRAFSMTLYNRWGEKVFYTTSLDGRGWDGKLDGVAQSTGVYVYVIEVEFINNLKKTFQGNVTLVR